MCTELKKQSAVLLKGKMFFSSPSRTLGQFLMVSLAEYPRYW